MPQFEYEAMSPDGRVVRGTVSEPDADAATRSIRERGLFITALTERGPAGERVPHPDGVRLGLSWWDHAWPWLGGLAAGLVVVAIEQGGGRGLAALLGWPRWTAYPLGLALAIAIAWVAVRWSNRRLARLAETEPRAEPGGHDGAGP